MSDNKLIAEFMGIEFEHVDTYQLPYNKDWNWLMPVAEKCLTTGDRQHFVINDALLTCNIEEVYKAVVEFIEEYNVQLKKDIKNGLYGEQ